MAKRKARKMMLLEKRSALIAQGKGKQKWHALVDMDGEKAQK
jgi:hypothetical protein